MYEGPEWPAADTSLQAGTSGGGVGSESDVIAEEGDAATIDLGCSLRLFDCYFFARIDTFAEKTVSPPDRK
jgi:hypothetical protein